MGKAAELALKRLEEDSLGLAEMRDRLESGLQKMEGVHVNGDPTKRLPHLTNLRFDGVKADELLSRLSSRLGCSTASACSSADTTVSHVLKAIGLSDEDAGSSVRFSLGRTNDVSHVDLALEWVTTAVGQLRSEASW
jgi:cysteine desulfurase